MKFIKELLQKILFIKRIDSHIIVRIFGIKLCFRYKPKFVMPELTELGITKEKRNPRIIVSLTTFPARINCVHKTITTLLTQTVKPDEVVLWLAYTQFPNKELPEKLTKLQEYGLTIKWCEDLRSFKKLVPSLREYPEDIIITVDDDIYYPNYLVANLYDEYLKNPNVIHSNRAFVVKKNKDNKLSINSRNFVYDKTFKPSYKNSMIGFGGVLYPPHSLHEKVLNSEIFMKIIPTNDDIWFWAMAVLNRTKIEVNETGFSCLIIEIENTQEVGLCNINNGISTEGMHGSKGVNVMVETFPEIMNILLEEKGEN